MKKRNRILTTISIIILFGGLGSTLIGRALGLRAYIFRTDDMYPTIKNGDRVIISKRAYKNIPPSVGDIVVFVLPENREKTYLRRITSETKEHSYYVSADNKSGKDSSDWGNIPKSDIIGEVILVYTGLRCSYNKLLDKPTPK